MNDKRTTIVLPPELHRAARIRAAELGISFGEAVRLALAAWLKS